MPFRGDPFIQQRMEARGIKYTLNVKISAFLQFIIGYAVTAIKLSTIPL